MLVCGWLTHLAQRPPGSSCGREQLSRCMLGWRSCAHPPAIDVSASVHFVIFHLIEFSFSSRFSMDFLAFSRYTVTASADGFATSFSVLDFLFLVQAN